MNILFGIILFLIIAPLTIMGYFAVIMFIMYALHIEFGYQPKIKTNRKPPNKGSNLKKD